MAERATETHDRVCLGVIVGAHGVRGQVRIKPFTEAPEAVAAYGAVTTDDGRTLDLSVAGTSPKGLVQARIAGVADRDAAAALRGTHLYVARDRLPPAADDEFYVADLVGLMARHVDGRRLGRVAAVQDFGAGAVLEVEPAEGGVLRRAVLVPFTRAVVPIVDRATHTLTIDPPDGLIDEEKDVG